jgi:hypothetical protein
MKWLALRVGGQRIGVYLVRPTHPKLEGCDGIYHPTESKVYISNALEESVREDTLFHELDHVVNDVSGANHALSAVVAPSKLESTEESIVRCRTPIWHRLLKDLGFCFPKGPSQ